MSKVGFFDDHKKKKSWLFQNKLPKEPTFILVMCVVAAGAGAARCVIFVRDMHESNIQNIHDMLVVERVEDIFALPAAFYEVVILEQLELVGNCRLCHVNGLCDVVDADLAVGYRAENFHPRFIAEHLKKCRGASY